MNQAATPIELDDSIRPEAGDHLYDELLGLGASGLGGHSWSPERVLAATVLVDGLMHVRDRYGEPNVRNEIDQDLRWIRSEDTAWPFSFVSLCDSFGLEPGSVRAVVWRWIRQAEHRRHSDRSESTRQRIGAKIVMLGRARRRR